MKFFRKIRKQLSAESKTQKYLRYAIGEIILVVIGILIALQINNWNEARKTQMAQKDLLLSLLEDLKVDETKFKEDTTSLSSVLKLHENLFLFRKKMMDENEIENPILLRGSFRHSSILLTNHPDIGTQILDKEVRKEMLNYYRLLFNLNNAYDQFDKVIKEIVRPYLSENITLNEEFMLGNNANDTISPLILDKFYTMVDQDYFGQLLFEANLKTKEVKAIFEKVLEENQKLQQLIELKLF